MKLKPIQRDFLLWWLINYGESEVNFYNARQEYLGVGVTSPDVLFKDALAWYSDKPLIMVNESTAICKLNPKTIRQLSGR